MQPEGPVERQGDYKFEEVREREILYSEKEGKK
jgi:hypothetical protein